MKTPWGAVVMIGLAALPVFGKAAGPEFETHFFNRTLRVDYYHIGDAGEEIVTIDGVYLEGPWAGSKTGLIDPFDRGRYAIKIYDETGKTLLFSRGFDSYFGEYRTTDAAAGGVKRTYHETALIPQPKSNVTFVLEARERDNSMRKVFETILPIRGAKLEAKRSLKDVKVFELRKNGSPNEKADLAFIAEGYTAAEESRLRADLDRMVEILFSQEPYRSLSSKFNLYGVWKPSEDSGNDEPGFGLYKNTAVSTTFDSLGTDRYVLTEDNRSLRDIAGHVPYDALVIMINQNRYGGGGIYNAFCTCAAGNEWRDYLFLHEFGHSFTGLADEYYTSEVAYNEFYPPGVEPREPNITALLDPKNVKWKTVPGIAIPTPWEKDEYDRNDIAYQKLRRRLNDGIAALKLGGASAGDVAKAEEESDRKSKEQAAWVDAFLAASAFAGKAGVYEGAGYAAKGLYRPAVDCIMFTRGRKPYCPVCAEAVRQMILFYAR